MGNKRVKYLLAEDMLPVNSLFVCDSMYSNESQNILPLPCLFVCGGATETCDHNQIHSCNKNSNSLQSFQFPSGSHG